MKADDNAKTRCEEVALSKADSFPDNGQLYRDPALKHAWADQVWVALTREDNFISLEITDNGIGFNLDQARGSGGLGLASMQERVAELQGTIQIASAPGAGTSIHVRIPDPGAEAKDK